MTNLLLQELMADLSPRTNHLLEGWLKGDLTITKGNSDSMQTLEGYGKLAVQDGLLWEAPIFGIFSPILNGISPGLGNSRASGAAGTFTITNGILRTDDLEIRSSAMRLQYRGSIDWQERVDAKVEAELLRDIWLVGPLVSTVFWPVTKMFEYKVSGTLAQPKTEPLFFVPKIVSLPFRPFRSLKPAPPEEPPSTESTPPKPP
jgi:hypothetical protein